MPVPATNEDFLDVVRKSNQVDTGLLDACLQQHREGDTLPPDPKKLAALLVREGLLTNFQAEQFLKGRWRGFALGGYRILERIGSGGSGAVFLGEHEAMKRRVAVKILPPSVAADPAVLERFRREAQAAAALDHPNIVRAYDFRQEGATHFLVMEYVNGPSLQQVLEGEGPLSVPVACEYVRQAAVGLQHAHEQGIIHRDIKPGNILVDPSGIVKVLDMGLARFTPQGQDSLTKQFDDNSVMGTADYLAPEQALSLHNVDARADIYSLGATLYALLAGEAPFASGTVTQKLLWHQMRDPTPLDQRRPEVPPEVADLVAGMMAKDISQRYQSAAEVAEELAPFCATTPTPQGPARLNQSNGTGSSSYVKATDTGAGSSVRLGGPRSGRRMAAPPAEREPITDEPSRRRDDWDDDDRDRPRRRDPGVRGRNAPDDIDVRRPADASSLNSILLLAGVMGAILLIVAGVVAFLIFGPPPGATSQAMSDPNAGRPIEKSRPADGGAAVAPAPPRDVIVLEGDTQGLERVTSAPDGRTLFTGGRDKLIRVWDVPEHRATAAIPGHAAEVYFVRFAPSGTKLLSCSGDGTARLWGYPAGNEIKRFDVEKGKVRCVLFGRNENEVVTAGDDGVVRLWHADSGKKIHEMKGHVGPILGMASRNNPNHHVVTAGQDNTLRVWDIQEGKEVAVLRGHTGPCACVAVTLSGEIAASGSHDGAVRLWNLKTSQCYFTFQGQHQGGVWAVAVTPDGKRAVSGGVDGKVNLWDVPRMKHERTFVGHAESVTGVTFSPEGKNAVSCSLDRTLRVWVLPPTQ
jgi:serine/threonine protein kinase